MVTANSCTSLFLNKNGLPSIQRVVSKPEKWSEIVQTAAKYGGRLPQTPDSRALRAFLLERKQADPLVFTDLSLTVIKLLGRGEYVFTASNEESKGHFALAIKDYTHSTAPNRRYTDLITQRLVRAILTKESNKVVCPYSDEELHSIAERCTEMQSVISKIERQLVKSAAAFLLEDHIGEDFEGIVTKAAGETGSYVRLLDLPIEGKILRKTKFLNVGDRIQVVLEKTNAKHGWIDFVMQQHESGDQKN